MIFLIEYDRNTGSLVEIRSFADAREEAENERLRLEIELLRSATAREVVLLEAPTEEDLHRTHRRYFEQLEELMKPKE